MVSRLLEFIDKIKIQWQQRDLAQGCQLLMTNMDIKGTLKNQNKLESFLRKYSWDLLTVVLGKAKLCFGNKYSSPLPNLSSLNQHATCSLCVGRSGHPLAVKTEEAFVSKVNYCVREKRELWTIMHQQLMFQKNMYHFTHNSFARTHHITWPNSSTKRPRSTNLPYARWDGNIWQAAHIWQATLISAITLREIVLIFSVHTSKNSVTFLCRSF